MKLNTRKIAPASDIQWKEEDEEEVVVKGQQKIFSKAERAYYAQKENCKSDIEKRYHHMVKDLSEDYSATIFTYINNDNFKPIEKFGDTELKLTSLRKNAESAAKVEDVKKSQFFIDPEQRVVSSR